MKPAPEALQIRRATPQDAAALHENCFSCHSLEAVTAALEADLAPQAAGQRVRVVAVLGGVAVGNAMLICKQHILERHIGAVHDVVVCGHVQGRGIARHLFEYLEAEARTMSLHILMTSVRAGTGAEQVYRKLGFAEYGRLPGGIREPWENGQVYDHVFFWKRLE